MCVINMLAPAEKSGPWTHLAYGATRPANQSHEMNESIKEKGSKVERWRRRSHHSFGIKGQFSLRLLVRYYYIYLCYEHIKKKARKNQNKAP